MLCYVKLYCIILNILSFEDEDNYEDDYDDGKEDEDDDYMKCAPKYSPLI